MFKLDTQIIERIKPAAGKAKNGAVEFINHFTYDPHPRRTKFIRGIKFSIIPVIAAFFFGRSTRTTT